MKKKNKKRVVYHEPPMKYNVALHKFEPDLPIIKKGKTENKDQLLTIPLIISIIIIIIGLAVILYLMSQVR